MQVLPVRLIGARSLTAPNTTVAVQCTSPLIGTEMPTPLSESRCLDLDLRIWKAGLGSRLRGFESRILRCPHPPLCNPDR